MTRTYYRLTLTVLCALAAYIVPVLSLRYPYYLAYFAGGLVASFLAWAMLLLAIALEPEVNPGLQFILGAGAAVISWAHITFVALFHILPMVMEAGRLLDTFDPIWLLGGLSPVLIPVVVLWLSRDRARPILHVMASALFRFSVPLAVLALIPRWLGLPRQFRWLFLFTGVMFLVLDGLGTGGPLPFYGRRTGRGD